MADTTQFGVHLHSYSDFNAALTTISNNGSDVIRYESTWHLLQPTAPVTGFIADSFSMTDSEFDQYMIDRGYYYTDPDGNPVGTALSEVVSELQAGQALGLNYLFSNGLTPSWASSAVQGAGESDGAFESRAIRFPPSDVATFGEFWQDFVSYVARKGGPELLNTIVGYEIGNEANAYDYFSGGNYPVSTYLELSSAAYDGLHAVYETYLPDLAPPDVSAVSFAGAWDGPNWQQVIDGQIKFDSITIHPYGTKVTPWRDPIDGHWPGEPDQSSSPLFGKALMPTDDYLTWKADTERDLNDSLELFSTNGSGADEYLNQNTETGVERTMAQFYGHGHDNVTTHFSEWGISTRTGDFENAQFLNPFLFPDGYTFANAQIAQALVLIQTVALFSDWDFIKTATVFELNDQAVNPGDNYDPDNPPDSEGFFGLYDIDGVLKPAGAAYFAFLRGEGFDGTTVFPGLNLQIDVAGNNWDFTGTVGHELLVARDGNDTVAGGAGDDVIFGGEGDDVLSGEDGYDRLYGGAGNDILNGGNGRDKLKGGEGNDILTGGAGQDQFAFAVFSSDGSGFSGHDTITDFTIGDDIIAVTGGFNVRQLLANAVDHADGVIITLGANGSSVQLTGVTRFHLTTVDFFALAQVARDAAIIGSRGNDITQGAETSDLLFALAGDDTLNGLGGDDELHGGKGNDVLNGGDGVDTAAYTGARTEVFVDLRLQVNDTKGAGTDILSGIENLSGSVFADKLDGDCAANTLSGNDGDDRLTGNGGADVFFGGNGNDRIQGGADNDKVDGDDGSDIIHTLAGSDVLDGGAGRDFLYGGQGKDTLTGGEGDDELRGNRGSDFLSGGTGSDDLRGGGGNDELEGGNGKDYLFGENGIDRLTGGLGNDALTGGALADTFVYENIGSGFDRIKDFENGIDVIDLTDFGFADFAAVQEIASDTATGLRIDTGGGNVLFVEGFALAEFDVGDVLL